MFKKITALIIGTVMFTLLLMGCSKSNKITIGSKDFTENKILAEMMAQLIENNSDIKVQRKINMGGTFVCFQALKKGQIDLYPEYTGTGLTAQLKQPVQTDPDRVYEIVSKEFEKKFNIKWLKPVGFNNTYALAVKREVASKYKMESVSDLAKYSKNLVFGGEHEFFNREDGYNGMIKTYNLKFKSTAKMDVSLKYQAIGQGKMDVTDAFTTDGQLKALNLKVLKDDKNFFPPYYAAPIVRDAALKKYLQLEKLLNRLAGTINNETMQELNYKVDNQKQSISKVAGDFLKKKGLIK
ncbi:glycine betaine ABC transporter substrate-binding protein [Clostridium oryzae]|uniref:Glycine betaine/carnitine/choline-binding protein OpuCC n=1 Tax=Clostridium oryzae TaxID=1450648 RepID=A0A1V4IXG8_9CLOT|nr:glycine betaine ABC transporter substrate-binding protein [Clostridium oryzae]OPJ64646.1 glycine betaine/carnitine/choline-binding protein OpuCC precursor [Clostridium oryzae]